MASEKEGIEAKTNLEKTRWLYRKRNVFLFFCCQENEDGWFLLRFVQVDKNFRCISGFLVDVFLFILKQHPSGPSVEEV